MWATCKLTWYIRFKLGFGLLRRCFPLYCTFPFLTMLLTSKTTNMHWTSCLSWTQTKDLILPVLFTFDNRFFCTEKCNLTVLHLDMTFLYYQRPHGMRYSSLGIHSRCFNGFIALEPSTLLLRAWCNGLVLLVLSTLETYLSHPATVANEYEFSDVILLSSLHH